MSDYIRDLAKETAKDFYFAALFAPTQHQDALFTLAAFHGEVSGIRRKIKNELAGQVRLQWWHDALETRREEAFNNPLFKALVETIDKYHLPKHLLLNKINAHLFDLYDDPFPDVNTMEGHYGETLSSLFMLNSLVLACVPNATLSGYVGVAYGLWCNRKTDIAEPLKYFNQAKPLLDKNNKLAHLPLLFTPHSKNIGELRKLWLMFKS